MVQYNDASKESAITCCQTNVKSSCNIPEFLITATVDTNVIHYSFPEMMIECHGIDSCKRDKEAK